MRNISVYRRSYEGKIICVHTFAHVDDLFETMHPGDKFEAFSNNINSRHRACRGYRWDKEQEWLSIHYPYYSAGLESFRTIDIVVNSYVVYDERDKLVTKDRLVGLFRAYRRKKDEEWYKKYVLRRPHPGSKRRWHFGNWYRYPQTTQEIRYAAGVEADKEEFEPPYRARRNMRNLPHSWDDKPRSTDRRCWKNYRDHQWKPK